VNNSGIILTCRSVGSEIIQVHVYLVNDDQDDDSQEEEVADDDNEEETEETEEEKVDKPDSRLVSKTVTEASKEQETDSNAQKETQDETAAKDAECDSENDDSRIFYAHKSVLCQSSGFFKAATKLEWKSTEPRTIDLSDEDPKVFRMYLQWLYTQKVAFLAPTGKTNDGEAYHVSAEPLIDSYLIGEKLIDPTYQNAVIKALMRGIHEKFVQFPSDEIIRHAYQYTTQRSPLRKRLVDFHVWAGESCWTIGNVVKITCAGFANDLITALMTLRSKPDVERDRPWVKNPESYTVQVDMKTTKVSNKPEGIAQV
jgi:hypothetical protein